MLRVAVMVEYSVALKSFNLHHIGRRQSALICAALVTVLAFALRFYQLGHEALWIDEALTDLFSRRPLKAIWRSGIEADLTPPLWYTLQKAWMFFGNSEFVLRTPAALVGTLTVPVVIAIGRLVADSRAALFAGLLLATSVVHLHYSQEARSYALLALSASLAIWGLIYILENPARAMEAFRTDGAAAGGGTARLAWAAYAAGSILALYSHNTAVFLVAWANICWLIVWLRTGRSRSFFIGWTAVNLAVVASFAWWVPVIIEQSVITLREGSFGKSYTSWGALADALKPVYGIRFAPLPTWFTALGATILATYGAWRMRANLPAVIVLFGSILFVPLATALFSFWRPILVDRVLLWPVVSLTILVAVGIWGLPRRSTLIAATVLIGLNFLGTAKYYNEDVKPAWRAAASFVHDGTSPSDGLVFWPFFERVPFGYTFERVYSEKPNQSNWYGAYPWKKSEIDGFASLKGGWNKPEVSFSEISRRYKRIWIISLQRQKAVAQSLRYFGSVEMVSDLGKIQIFRLDTFPSSN
jgi:uncharacterized membrane protein